MDLMKYFSEAEVIDDKCIKIAIEEFGELKVKEFFSNIKNNFIDNQDLVKKLDKYLVSTNFSNEINALLNEMDEIIRISSNEPIETLSVADAYFKEVSKYPLLSLEQEQKYCKDIKLKNDITILKDEIINGKEMNILDLDKLFISLIDNEYAPVIIKSLKAFHAQRESGYHSIINYYLETYEKLVTKLGHYPNYCELVTYFSRMDKYKILSFDSKKMDKMTLLEEIKKYLKYLVARDIMINCNLRLVVSVAKNYNSSIELIDLINQGNLGLITAVSKFDVNLGYHFSTYAVYWIKQSIIRYLYNDTSAIKVTQHVKMQMNKFRRELYKLEQEHQRRLLPDEIAKYLNMPLPRVIDYLNYGAKSISLDEIISQEENDLTLSGLVWDKNADVEEESYQSILKNDIQRLLNKLSPREAYIIILRYGLGEENGVPHTLQEISDIVGVTRERVRQIESKALGKMKTFVKKPSFSHLSEY